MSNRHERRVGSTYGESRPRPGFTSEGARCWFDPAQLSVKVDPDAEHWVDGDGRDRPPRSVWLEATEGYATPVRLYLTEFQAAELAPLLALAGRGATAANIVAARACVDADRELFNEIVELAQRARTRHEDMKRYLDNLATLIPGEDLAG